MMVVVVVVMVMMIVVLVVVVVVVKMVVVIVVLVLVVVVVVVVVVAAVASNRNDRKWCDLCITCNGFPIGSDVRMVHQGTSRTSKPFFSLSLRNSTRIKCIQIC